jgi:hypothetical protein
MNLVRTKTSVHYVQEMGVNFKEGRTGKDAGD